MESLNRSVVRLLMENVWGQGNLNVIPSLISEEYIGHLPIGDHYGPEGVRIDDITYRHAFPDLIVTLDDLFANDDRVVRRYTLRGTHSTPHAGVRGVGDVVVLRAIAIDRLVGGQLVESWVQGDSYPPVRSYQWCSPLNRSQSVVPSTIEHVNSRCW